jgi:hypothetical protein
MEENNQMGETNKEEQVDTNSVQEPKPAAPIRRTVTRKPAVKKGTELPATTPQPRRRVAVAKKPIAEITVSIENETPMEAPENSVVVEETEITEDKDLSSNKNKKSKKMSNKLTEKEKKEKAKKKQKLAVAKEKQKQKEKKAKKNKKEKAKKEKAKKKLKEKTAKKKAAAKKKKAKAKSKKK